MAKAPKDIELEQGKSVLGAGNQKQVERLLKKAADKAAKEAKKKWAKAGRNPFSRHANARMGRIEKALTKALAGALNLHANNSGPRPSIKMTAPDTGGRPFHFSHTTVSASGASKAYKAGTAAAHMSYIDRESAVEQAMLEEGVDLSLSSREIDAEAFGRDPAERMQSYIEDAEKVEAAKAAQTGQEPQPLAFTFGNIGDTKEERRAFWQLVEDHPERGNARLQSRVILELPVESTPAQRLEIVKEYVKGLEARGLRYHAALHAPTNKNDPRNFHAHVIYMTRPAKKVDFAFDGLDDGTIKPTAKVWDFACVAHLPDANKHRRKTYPHRQNIDPDTRPKKFIPNERKRLADIVNTVMAKAGSPVRYDPRSYKAMGIEVEAMRSLSRIIADKAKGDKRVILDEGRTKRDIEAEVRRVAQERAPEYAEVSKVRAAVRAGDRELRQLEKDAAFLRRKTILKRGVHAVKTAIKRKALDYARTKALHVERTIEAIQEIRSLERVVEATRPEAIAQIHAKLEARLGQARKKDNEAEVERLKTEIKAVPEKAIASLLHDVAKDEVERLKAREQRASASRLARVRNAVEAWRQAALGRTANLDPAATGATVETPGPVVRSQSQDQPAPEAKPREHPMWAPYESAVGDLFKTDFEKYMFGVMKRYGQFIIDNADVNVPGRTAEDLAAKLVEAVKQHPAKAEELIMSYDNGRETQRLGFPEGRPEPAAAADAPAFKRGRVPQPRAEDVEPHPYEMEPLARRPRPEPAPAAEPPRPTEPAPAPPPPPSKPKPKRKQRRRAILAQRGGPDRS